MVRGQHGELWSTCGLGVNMTDYGQHSGFGVSIHVTVESNTLLDSAS
jgi:hypothetical protein